MPDAFAGSLVSLGWSDRVLALFNEVVVDDALPARVVRVERSGSVVCGADGAERFCAAVFDVAVGDWIVVRRDIVIDVLPRWSSLSRLDPDGRTVQVLAANVDVVLIIAPADRLSPNRIQREMVVAWDSGAQPHVVVTKSDLADRATIDGLRDRLIGAEIAVTSASTGFGIEAVRDLLRPNRTAVLFGPSGAGKSTLANRLADLAGDEELVTGEVRQADARGRHTTSSRQLVPVPSGGVLIDTPGLRSLGLAAQDSDGIGRVFADIETLAVGCRFSDCRHDREPGCAVSAALDVGEIDAGRLASYHKLLREVAALDRRSDPLARKAQLSAWKAMVKSTRANDKRRRG